MTTKNDITGDLIKTKESNQAYSDGWDLIFGKKKEEQPKQEEHSNIPQDNQQ